MNTLTSARLAAPALSFNSSVRSSSALRPASSAIRRRVSATGCALAFSDDIARLDAGLGRRTIRIDRHDHRTLEIGDVDDRQADGRLEERQAAIETPDGEADRLRVVETHVDHVGLGAAGGEQRDDQAVAVGVRRNRDRGDALGIEHSSPAAPTDRRASPCATSAAVPSGRLFEIERQPVGRQLFGGERLGGVVGRRREQRHALRPTGAASRSSAAGRC